MDRDSVTIDGVDYVRREKSSDWKIVVLHRGHVLVGRVRRDGEMVHIDDASVIRIWGTTRGLGEIAKNGPTSKTILDPCHGTASAHILAVVLMIDCEAGKWTSK